MTTPAVSLLLRAAKLAASSARADRQNYRRTHAETDQSSAISAVYREAAWHLMTCKQRHDPPEGWTGTLEN